MQVLSGKKKGGQAQRGKVGGEGKKRRMKGGRILFIYSVGFLNYGTSVLTKQRPEVIKIGSYI